MIEGKLMGYKTIPFYRKKSVVVPGVISKKQFALKSENYEFIAAMWVKKAPCGALKHFQLDYQHRVSIGAKSIFFFHS